MEAIKNMKNYKKHENIENIGRRLGKTPAAPAPKSV